MVNVEQFQMIRFFVGFIGTISYFMCIKHGFLTFELENPENNSNTLLDNKAALIFFCFIGGLMPWMLDIRQPIGWFLQGFSLRLTLSALWSSSIYKERSIGVRKND